MHDVPHIIRKSESNILTENECKKLLHAILNRELPRSRAKDLSVKIFSIPIHGDIILKYSFTSKKNKTGIEFYSENVRKGQCDIHVLRTLDVEKILSFKDRIEFNRYLFSNISNLFKDNTLDSELDDNLDVSHNLTQRQSYLRALHSQYAYYHDILMRSTINGIRYNSYKKFTYKSETIYEIDLNLYGIGIISFISNNTFSKLKLKGHIQ